MHFVISSDSSLGTRTGFYICIQQFNLRFRANDNLSISGDHWHDSNVKTFEICVKPIEHE